MEKLVLYWLILAIFAVSAAPSFDDGELIRKLKAEYLKRLDEAKAKVKDVSKTDSADSFMGKFEKEYENLMMSQHKEDRIITPNDEGLPREDSSDLARQYVPNVYQDSEPVKKPLSLDDIKNKYQNSDNGYNIREVLQSIEDLQKAHQEEIKELRDNQNILQEELRVVIGLLKASGHITPIEKQE